MNKVKLCFDNQQFRSKPTNEDAAHISKRIGRNTMELSPAAIRAFALDVSLDGRTFCPATFKDNNRRKDSFEQQQLFALDFDGGISFEDVKKRADNYELPVLFAYDTLSSIDHNKFRVVFLSDVPIEDRIVAEGMLHCLGTMFPEADRSCYKDVSKMYYGGKEVLHLNDSIPSMNIEAVFRNTTRCLKDRYKANHYKGRLAKLSEETGIALNEHGLLDVTVFECPTETLGADPEPKNGKISPNAILYRIANGENFPNKYYCIKLKGSDGTGSSSVAKNQSKNHSSYRSSVLRDMSLSCQLLREFAGGNRRLSHDELFGLATNLAQVESGYQHFRNTLNRHTHLYADKISKWNHDLSYMKQLGYKPQCCDGFCPHRETCSHSRNLLSTAKPKRGTVERIPGFEPEYDSVEAVEDDVFDAVSRAYESGGKTMQVIKAMTGAGKTTAYLKLMSQNPGRRFLIAAPTNLLKTEITIKAAKLGIEVKKTPSLEEIKDSIPRKVWKHIQRLYKTGEHRAVHPYIAEMLKKRSIPCLREYLNEREKSINFNGSVITTHRYLLNMDEKRLHEYDAIIIDEDIIFKSVITNQDEISISKLKKLLRKTTDVQLQEKINNLLKLAKSRKCIELDGFHFEYDEDGADGISSGIDIPSFCLCEKFYVRRADEEKNLYEDTIAFIKPVVFKDVNYIMVSATVNEQICCDYFGAENTQFYECKEAEYLGTLHQYTEKSMSRTSIDNDPGVIQSLMKRFSIDNVITFMKYNIGQLHFGNTEGSNSLEGEDILVIGTPYHAAFLYKLVAFTMDLPFDEDAEMKLVTAEHNGYRFRLTTYDDEVLRNIQFWMLESELEQAVGRARLLRNDCSVHLFSSFPLRQAVLKTAGFD